MYTRMFREQVEHDLAPMTVLRIEDDGPRHVHVEYSGSEQQVKQIISDEGYNYVTGKEMIDEPNMYVLEPMFKPIDVDDSEVGASE